MLSPQPHFTTVLEATKEIWDLPKAKHLALQEARVPRSHFESSEEEKNLCASPSPPLGEENTGHIYQARTHMSRWKDDNG